MVCCAGYNPPYKAYESPLRFSPQLNYPILRITQKGIFMSNYRRAWQAGGTYFFTGNILERKKDLWVRHIDTLREAVRRVNA